MQNCLHSRLREKTIPFVLAVALTMAAISGVLLAVYLNSGTSDKVKYLSGEGFGNFFESTDEKRREKEKMNNDFSEVAKNDKTTAQTYILPVHGVVNVNVLMNDGTVSVMELEEYVKGCVCGEMPLSFEPQAIMAQSVAVRTFTLRQIVVKSKHRNADVCVNPACCQNFVDTASKKMSDENEKKLNECVGATQGVIMIYDGVPINAVYHASSGDKTLSSEEVWGGRLDYLVSVDAPEGEKEIYSGGYGHRVGMSQHGANLLAGEGKNYMEILKYYYNGISFAFT